MELQLLLAFCTLLAGCIILFSLYQKRRFDRIESDRRERLTLDSLLNIVKQNLADMLKGEALNSVTGEDWERLYTRLKRITQAMTDCVFCIEKAKIIVKDLIVNIIQKVLRNDEEVDSVLDLNSSNLLPMIKFEILLYFLNKRPDVGKGSIDYLFKKYHMDDVKYLIEDGTVPHYAWTLEELNMVYDSEMKDIGPIKYLDKLEVIATLLYSKYKGLGIIDTLRDQRIDGLNFGTSGSVLADVLNRGKNVARATASVWLYYQGKFVHLQFLDFGSIHEMRRVALLVCRYGNPGPLTEKRGYMVTHMHDQSRVLAVRPPVAECWAVFIRKFDLGDMTLERLVDPLVIDKSTREVMKDKFGNIVHKYKNAILPYLLIVFLIKGQVTCGFTGRQGSGKTTIMKYSLSAADARHNIRILEMTAELYLREVFDWRNILSLQETSHCTAADLQDALKKSDAALSIVGEVATDIVAARMIQMGQVASVFTIFSHHANRTEDLVQALTNSIVASSHGAATPDTVEPQVIDVVKIDIHLDYTVKGDRYIERITEIVRTDENRQYVDIDPNNVEYCRAINEKVYYEKRTVSKRFKAVNIMHFDLDTWTYVPDSFFSEELTKHIISRLPEDYVDKFLEFAEKNWGSAA